MEPSKRLCKEGQVFVRITDDMKDAMLEVLERQDSTASHVLYCLFGKMVTINAFPVYLEVSPMDKTKSVRQVHKVIDHFKGTIRIGDFMFTVKRGKNEDEAKHNACLAAILKILMSRTTDYLCVMSSSFQVLDKPRFKGDWEGFEVPSKIKEYIKASKIPILHEMPKMAIMLLFNDYNYRFETYEVSPNVRFWEEAMFVSELRLNGYGRFLSFGSTVENAEMEAARFMLRVLFPDLTYGNDIQIFPQSPALISLPNHDDSVEQLILAGVHAYKIGVAAETLHSLYNFTEIYYYNAAVKSYTCEIDVAGKKFYGFGVGEKEARGLAARDALCQLFCHYPNNASAILLERKYC